MPRGTRRRQAPGRRGERRSHRLSVEALEPRRLLAAVAWDGGGDGRYWEDALNWSTDTVPTARDDVTISANVNSVSIQTSAVARSLNLSQRLQVLSGNSLQVDSASVVNASGRLQLYDANLTGAGSLVNHGTVESYRQTRFTIPLENDNLLVISSGTLTLENGDVTNRGSLNLTNIGFPVATTEAAIVVTSGKLINEAAGTITATVGDRDGARRILAELDNSGVVTAVDTILRIKADNAHHLNSGTMRAKGGDIYFESSNSVIVTNTGIVDIGAGHELAGWTLEWVGTGTYTGSGKLRLNRGTLTLPTDLELSTITLAPENATTIEGSGTLINRSHFFAGPGTTYINVPVVNEGSFTASIGDAELTQTFENRENALLRIASTPRQGGNTIWGNVAMAHGFENFGTISLEHNYHGVILDIAEGTLINHGLIKTTGPGNSNSAEEGISLRAELDNRGEIAVSSRLIIHKSGASHVNSGVIRLESDGTDVAAPSRALRFKNAAVFENRGTIVISPGYSFNTNTGLLQTAGAIDVVGVLDPRTFALQGGVLRGSGVVKSPVANSAVVQPGNSVGKLRIEGDYSQTAAGSLQIDVADPTTYDRLEVTGAVTLAGTLEVNVEASYLPEPSLEFDVLTHNTWSGEFDNVLGTRVGATRQLVLQSTDNKTSLVVERVFKTWDAGGDGVSWHDALNWNDDVLPNSAADVLIDFGDNSGAIVLSQGNVSVRSLDSLTPLTVSGGQLTLAEDSVMQAPFVLSGDGELTGAGQLTLEDLFTWTGGTVQGNVVANSELFISGSAVKAINGGGRLTNQGQGTWTAGDLSIASGSALVNEGNLGFQTDTSATGGGLIHNKLGGTLIKSSGGGVQDVAVNFTNDGNLQISSGVWQVNATLVSSNSIQVDDGAVFEIRSGSGAHQLAGTTLSGAGEVLLTSGTVEGRDGEVIVHADTTLRLVGSTLNASATIHGPLHWTGGTIQGSVVAAGNVFISGSAVKALNGGGRLTIQDQGTWIDAGDISIASGSALVNEGAFDVQTNAPVTGGGVIHNQLGAAWNKRGDGEQAVATSIINDGTLELLSGTLLLQNQFTQSAGATVLSGGNISSNGVLAIQAGTLSGTGIVSADLNSGGRVEPGTGAPLTIDGDYEQASGGVLSVAIGGTNAGAEHDQLIVTGMATLGGALEFSLDDGYQPGAATGFDVLTYGSRAGEFASINGSGLGGVSLLEAVYGGDRLSLILEPSTGDASEASTLLAAGWDSVVASLIEWADSFNLDSSDLPVLPSELADAFHLADEFASLSLPELDVSNSYEAFHQQLDSLGFSVDCISGGVPGANACSGNDYVQARYEETFPLSAALADYSDDTPGVLEGIFSTFDLDGDVQVSKLDLNVQLVLGVDENGFYLIGESQLGLRVEGSAAVNNLDASVPVEQLGGTANAAVEVIVQPANRVERYRDVMTTTTDLTASATGDADLALTIVREPLTLAWQGEFEVSTTASTITTNVNSVTMSGTLAVPGLSEDGGATDADLQLEATAYDGGRSWKFSGEVHSEAGYTLAGFGVDELTFEIDLSQGLSADEDEFSVSVAIELENGQSELAGILPLAVERIGLQFNGTTSGLDEFEIDATVSLQQSFVDTMPFQPVLGFSSEQTCDASGGPTSFQVSLDSAALQGDPQLTLGSLEVVTLGIEDLQIGEVTLGGCLSMSDFVGGLPRVVAGTLSIESGIDVINEDGIAIEGFTIDMIGEFTESAGDEPHHLDLYVDGVVNLNAMIKDVMELKDMGFKFHMSFENVPDSFDPSFESQLNQINVREVTVEFGDLMILRATENITFNFNDPDSPGSIPDPIAVLGEVGVEFRADTLSGLSFTITNLEINDKLLPELAGITSVTLGIPDIVQESMLWLPITIDQLGLKFHQDLLKQDANGIGIDAPTAFSVIASGGVTSVEWKDEVVMPLVAEVRDLVIDVEKLARREYPITGIGGVTFGVVPFELVEGFTIGGVMEFQTLSLDTGPGCGLLGDDTVLYGRILGQFEFEGYGGGVELVVSEFGPVAGTFRTPLAIALGQTGFMITGAAGTLQFGQPPLPDVTDARQLNGNEFQNPLDKDFGDDDVVREFLAASAQACAATWTQSFTLALSGTFTHAAVAGLLSGEVTLASMVGLEGEQAGLNLMGYGDLNVMGVTLAEARLLFDLRDALQPKFAAAIEAPPGDNILSLFIPAKAEAAALLTTKGIARAAMTGVQSFVNKAFELIVEHNDAAFTAGRGLFESVMEVIADRLSSNPAAPFVDQIDLPPKDTPFAPHEVLTALQSFYQSFQIAGALGEAQLQTNATLINHVLTAIPEVLAALEQSGMTPEQQRQQLGLTSGIAGFPTYLDDLVSSLGMRIPVNPDGTVGVSDGDTFTIQHGQGSETFEFDENGEWTDGNTPIPFASSNALVPSTPFSVAANIAAAIIEANIGIAAFAAGGVVKLAGATSEHVVNLAETSLTLVPAMSELAQDALGAFMDVLREATQEAIRDVADSVDADLFDPSLTIAGEITPAILGIPLGKPPAEGELILNKRGLSYGADFSIVKTANVLAAAASGPLAGTVTQILNLLPAPFSDRVFALMRFPFADTESGAGEALVSLVDGNVPRYDQLINPVSDNWAAVLRGTFNIFDIPLANIGGMAFPADSPHLLDNRIQKIWEDPDAALEDGKFQITEEEFYDAMLEYGGLLLSGGYTVPRFIRDPFQTLSDLPAPTLPFPSETEDVGPFLNEILDNLAEAQDVLSQVEELAKLQYFFPSFESVLQPNFNDYSVETARYSLTASSANVALPATIEISSEMVMDSTEGQSPKLLALGHELVTGQPVLLHSNDAPAGLRSGTTYYVTNVMPESFALAATRAAALAGVPLQINSSGSGIHAISRSAFITAPGNDLIVGDVVTVTGDILPNGLQSSGQYYVTDVLPGSFALAETAQQAAVGEQIDWTSAGSGAFVVAREEASGEARIAYDPALPLDDPDDPNNPLIDIINAAFFEGVLNDKLLGIELINGRVRGDANGVTVSGGIPWLGGLQAKFELQTNTAATLEANKTENDDPIIDGDLNPITVQLPWVGAGGATPIDSTTVIDGLTDWQRVLEALGIPANTIELSTDAKAEFIAYSPYFNVFSDDPLQKFGGFELTAKLDILNFVRNANFRFSLAPPDLSHTEFVPFSGQASVEQGELTLVGLSGAPVELLDLQDFVVTLGNDETGVATLGLQGTLQLLGYLGDDSLRLKVDGQLPLTPSGIIGDLPLQIVDEIGEAIQGHSGLLGLSQDSEFFLRFHDDGAGVSIHVEGGLDLPGPGFAIEDGRFDFTASDSSLRMDVRGNFRFLAQEMNVIGDSHLDVSLGGLDGSLSLSLSSGAPFLELPSLLGPRDPGPSWLIYDTDDPDDPQALSLGLTIDADLTEFMLAGNLEIPTLADRLYVGGPLDADGYGFLTGQADLVPIEELLSAFKLSGDIELQRFEDQGLPTLDLNVLDAALTWSGLTFDLGASPMNVTPLGRVAQSIPAQDVDLVPGSGDQGMQLSIPSGFLEFGPNRFGFGFGSSDLSIPGLPVAVPIPEVDIPDVSIGAVELPLLDASPLNDVFDLGVFGIVGADDATAFTLGAEPTLRFEHRNIPSTENGQPVVRSFPRVTILPLLDAAIVGDLVIRGDGTFEVDLPAATIGGDGLGIAGPQLSLQKTDASLDSLSLRVDGGSLVMPFVPPIDLPLLKVKSDGVIERIEPHGSNLQQFALRLIPFGSEFEIDSPVVTLSIFETMAGHDLEMTMVNDADFNVLGTRAELVSWSVGSWGGFSGAVDIPPDSPLTLPRTTVGLKNMPFSFKRPDSHFELHLTGQQEINTGFVESTFENDSYINSVGDYHFVGTVDHLVRFGTEDVLELSGNASTTLSKQGRDFTAEVRLVDGHLDLPFDGDEPIELPDLIFGLNGTLLKTPDLMIPNLSYVAESFGSPEFPVVLSISADDVVTLATLDTLDVNVLPPFLPPSYLPFDEISFDSAGVFSADIFGQLILAYPLALDAFTFPPVGYEVSSIGDVISLSPLVDQTIDLGFFDGVFSGYIQSNGIFAFTTDDINVDFADGFEIVGDGEATLTAAGFSASIADAALEVLGFPLLDTSHTFTMAQIGDAYRIRIPGSSKKGIDLGFLQVNISGSAFSDGNFSFSGTKHISFDDGTFVPGTNRKANKVSGTVSVTLSDEDEFDGSFSGAIRVAGFTTTGLSGTVSSRGCLRVGGNKFELPGGDCSGRYFNLRASDGFISEGRAFFDANANGVADFLDLNQNGVQDEGEPREPVSYTNADGSGGLSIPAEFDLDGNGSFDLNEGRIVVSGGMDLTTTLPLIIPLLAPSDVDRVAAVTPLTTLAVSLATQNSLTFEEATALILARFGLPAFDLRHAEPVSTLLSGDAAAADVFAANAQVYDTLTQVSHLLHGATGQSLVAGAATSTAEMANLLAAEAEAFDLTNMTTISQLIDNAVRQLSGQLDPTLGDAASLVIALSNQRIALTPTRNVDYLASVARVQHVAQGSSALDLLAAASGQMSIEELLSQNTGAGLAQRILAAEIGAIVPPEIAIGDEQRAVSGEETIFDFQVRLSQASRLPVTVEYATRDGSLIADDGDYLSLAGMLAFAPGETTKTIQVAVDHLQADSDFFVDLFAPVHAGINQGEARGGVSERFTLRTQAASEAVPGEPLQFVFFANLTGDILYEIDWDSDGQVDDIIESTETASATHAYLAAGIYNMRVSAVHQDTLATASARHAVQVSQVLHRDDSLLAGGTSHRDAIFFYGRPQDSTVYVRLNGERWGPYELAPNDRLIAYGQDGNDYLAVSAGLTRDSELQGGAGSDVLRGGRGNDVLVGQEGPDRLFGGGGDDTLLGGAGDDLLWARAGANLLDGGDGNDFLLGGLNADRLLGQAGDDFLYAGSGGGLLIGGAGRDTLIASRGDDLIVSGSTAHDHNSSALLAILAEWTSPRERAVRLANLLDGSGDDRENQDFFLSAETLIDDGQADRFRWLSDRDWRVD